MGLGNVVATIVVGVLLLAVTVAVELRTSEPIVALRLLGNRLFRSGNVVMVLVSVSFFGTLFAISLYYQDGRGMTALASGLSTFPEAIGVMAGAQLASRVLYRRLGPRRHITIGLVAVSIVTALISLLGASASLWWARVLMFALGFGMGQVFVPTQAASFATISPAATGRASTLFNAVRQLGGAVGVALLTTAIVIVGPTPSLRWPRCPAIPRLPGGLPRRCLLQPVRHHRLSFHTRLRHGRDHDRGAGTPSRPRRAGSLPGRSATAALPAGSARPPAREGRSDRRHFGGYWATVLRWGAIYRRPILALCALSDGGFVAVPPVGDVYAEIVIHRAKRRRPGRPSCRFATCLTPRSPLCGMCVQKSSYIAQSDSGPADHPAGLLHV